MKHILNFLSEKSLVSIIAYGPFIFIPLVVTMVSLFLLHINELQYQDSLEDMETVYVEAQKNKVISKVDIAAKLLEYKKSVTTEILKETVKNRVDTAYSIAKNIYDKNIKNHTKKELQKEIIDSLRSLTWNNGECYIFIVDFNGVSHLSPSYLKHFEGKNILDLQDADQRHIIREEIALAKEKGEGFIWDTFTRPNTDPNKQYEQLAYVKRFDDFDWYMGSAEYLDTVMSQMKEHALKTLRNMSINESEYFFVIDENGNNIMNGQGLFPRNENVLSLKDEDGKEFIKELIKSAKSKDPYFVSYKLKNPLTGQVEEKFSYVKKVPGSDWIVGNGFYYNAFNDKLQEKAESLTKMYKKQYVRIMIFSLVLIVLSLLVSYLISIALKNRLLKYSKEIKQKNSELMNLNASLEKTVVERTKELNQAYENMREIAMKDSLTEIYNRYYFNDALKNEIDRANRYHTTFSLCMFDLDYFKDVNDTYGHDVGDKILKSVVDLVKQHLRKSDIFARVGGEEFMIILPKTTLEMAATIVERIRTAVDNYTFEEIEHITISIGLVQYKENENNEEVLKRVDLALYNAKHSGRNTVIVDS